MPDTFITYKPNLEDCWRGIILFGRNVASYKFALAKSLLELQPQSGQLIKLEVLAEPFSRHVTEHLKLADKQGTSASSRLLDTCRQFNSGELTKDKLMDSTVQLGFNNVIDAFHVVNQGDIPKRFFIDERGSNQGIRITDEFSELMARPQSNNLQEEVEARWRLVETAWELGISRNIICAGFDNNNIESLFVEGRAHSRKPITSCRAALNGYQKGKCFYCFTDISIAGGGQQPDVDHFLPHKLKDLGMGEIIDGVWNLVLACQSCNRGEDGKFAKMPSQELLERIRKRNEFLINSHHPLRDTLIQQTGITEPERRVFLNEKYNNSHRFLFQTWKHHEVGPVAF